MERKDMQTKLVNNGPNRAKVRHNKPKETQNERAFVDASFEFLVREVDANIDIIKDALRGGQSSVAPESFDDLCRSIRRARLDFENVLRYYGSEYEGQAQHFVDAVHYATDLAMSHGNEKIRQSISNHAAAIQEIQCKMKDAS